MALFILLFAVSCSEDDPQSDLHGRWVWQKSSGGIAGVEYTPQSTGEVRILEITSDSLIYYTNDARTSGLAYKIELRESIFSTERSWQFVTGGFNISFELDGNTLYLAEECYDCFGHVYTRTFFPEY